MAKQEIGWIRSVDEKSDKQGKFSPRWVTLLPKIRSSKALKTKGESCRPKGKNQKQVWTTFSRKGKHGETVGISLDVDWSPVLRIAREDIMGQMGLRYQISFKNSHSLVFLLCSLETRRKAISRKIFLACWQCRSLSSITSCSSIRLVTNKRISSNHDQTPHCRSRPTLPIYYNEALSIPLDVLFFEFFDNGPAVLMSWHSLLWKNVALPISIVISIFLSI